MHRRVGACFNGATAMKPWKRWPIASIMTAVDGRFNGATAMKPWKSGLGVRRCRGHRSLQWGHGDEAVEETTSCTLLVPTIAVLQWGHGDEAVEEAARCADADGVSRRFNGATAMKPWKRPARHAPSPIGECFNGATAMKPWKRPP